MNNIDLESFKLGMIYVFNRLFSNYDINKMVEEEEAKKGNKLCEFTNKEISMLMLISNLQNIIMQDDKTLFEEIKDGKWHKWNADFTDFNKKED